MSIGALIAILGFSVLVAAGLLTVYGCLFCREEDEIIERRIAAMAPPVAPDHPGEIVPFKRRAS